MARRSSGEEEGEARADGGRCGEEGDVQEEEDGAYEEGERTEHPVRVGGHGRRDEPLRPTTEGVANLPKESSAVSTSSRT